MIGQRGSKSALMLMMYCYGEERFETQRRKCRDLQPCPLSLCCDRRTRSAQCYSCCTQKKNRRWFSNHRLRIFSRHPSDSQSLSCRLLFSQKDAEDEWPHPWQCLTRIRAYPHLSPGDHLQSNSWHHIFKQRLIKNYSVWFLDYGGKRQSLKKTPLYRKADLFAVRLQHQPLFWACSPGLRGKNWNNGIHPEHPYLRWCRHTCSFAATSAACQVMLTCFRDII